MTETRVILDDLLTSQESFLETCCRMARDHPRQLNGVARLISAREISDVEHEKLDLESFSLEPEFCFLYLAVRALLSDKIHVRPIGGDNRGSRDLARRALAMAPESDHPFLEYLRLAVFRLILSQEGKLKDALELSLRSLECVPPGSVIQLAALSDTLELATNMGFPDRVDPYLQDEPARGRGLFSMVMTTARLRRFIWKWEADHVQSELHRIATSQIHMPMLIPQLRSVAHLATLRTITMGDVEVPESLMQLEQKPRKNIVQKLTTLQVGDARTDLAALLKELDVRPVHDHEFILSSTLVILGRPDAARWMMERRREFHGDSHVRHLIEARNGLLEGRPNDAERSFMRFAGSSKRIHGSGEFHRWMAQSPELDDQTRQVWEQQFDVCGVTEVVRMSSSEVEMSLEPGGSEELVFDEIPADLAREGHHILLVGEPGTGKTTLARRLHEQSNPDRPVFCLHCGSLTPRLLEMELFGYSPSVMPGVRTPGRGLVEKASGGTVILECFHETPESLLETIAAVMTTGEYRPVGAVVPVRLNCRFIVTCRPGHEEILADLGLIDSGDRDRLVACHTLPPLRDQRDRISTLAIQMLKTQRPLVEVELGDDLVAALTSYDWPGNYLEFSREMEHLAAISEGRQRLVLGDLRREFRDRVAV